MKVRLRRRIILQNIPSEKQLLDESHIAALYAIRKLKALLDSEFMGSIEVSDEPNSHGQRFSKQHAVWIDKEEMI